MRATVKGMITHLEEASKGEGENKKIHTEILLLQNGERTQVRIRMPGHGHKYELMKPMEFHGRVMAWGKRSGEADFMLLCDI